MMFLLDLAFATELIALGVGVGILVWAFRNDGAGVALAKFFGYVITIAAIFVLLCSSFYGVKYWAKGYFKSPVAPMLIMKNKMMEKHPMMMQHKQKTMPSKPHQHSTQ